MTVALYIKGEFVMRYDEDSPYPEYIPVAQRRANAERKLRQLQKKHPHLQPVILDSQTLAKSWWGKSWNSNLERYADYSNRIGRGRSYVRHRAVLDLQLTSGKVTAMVQGSESEPYDVEVKVDKLSAKNWASIRKACEGAFDSLSELLAGKFPQTLKDLFFAKGAGLFPSPREIHFDCSCPDWASMCKHVAATLYGVGARLDDDPALFFTLRRINIDDLITQTVTETAQTLLSKAGQQSQNVLQDVDLGDVFGIKLDDMDASLPDLPPQLKTATAKKQSTQASKSASRPQRTRASKKSTTLPSIRQPKTLSVAANDVRTPIPAKHAAKTRASTMPPTLPSGTMLDALLKAVGRARKGKSVDQLQEKLAWTKIQVRNAISRANAKGLIETVKPGVYRRKV
jgi:uncharacterized Zn finger protein